MKTISSAIALLGISTVLGLFPSVVNAEPSPKPVISGGARYFKNLETGNVNRRNYEGVFGSDNKIIVTYPSFSISSSDTQNADNARLDGVSSSNTPQYSYNNQGVVILQLGEKQEPIPYNRQGDASLQLTRFRLGTGK